MQNRDTQISRETGSEGERGGRGWTCTACAERCSRARAGSGSGSCAATVTNPAWMERSSLGVIIIVIASIPQSWCCSLACSLASLAKRIKNTTTKAKCAKLMSVTCVLLTLCHAPRQLAMSFAVVGWACMCVCVWQCWQFSFSLF